MNQVIPKIAIEDDTHIYYQDGNIYSKKSNKFVGYINKAGYKRCMINKKLSYIHRVVYEKFIGKIPEGMVIDHMNNNPRDNRIDNLQCITKNENDRKRKVSIDNQTGYLGLTKRNRPKSWKVQIFDDKVYTKSFETLHSALIWRKYVEFQLGYGQIKKKGYKRN